MLVHPQSITRAMLLPYIHSELNLITVLMVLLYIFHSGTYAGTLVALTAGGWLCDSWFLGGWPAAFYVFGAVGLVWSAAWFLLVHERPEKHPRISQAELSFIQSSKHSMKEAKVS